MNQIKALAVSALAIAGAGVATRASANITSIVAMSAIAQQAPADSVKTTLRPDLQKVFTDAGFVSILKTVLRDGTGIKDGAITVFDHKNGETIATFGNAKESYFIDFGGTAPRYEGHGTKSPMTVVAETTKSVKENGGTDLEAVSAGLKEGWFKGFLYKKDAKDNVTRFELGANGKFNKMTPPAPGGGQFRM